ncbi:MAG: M48 family metalloprotease, partial [Gorillibacterium sp.]|nr:M48 family metalloprotease [Gorillibacterium sp.]
MSFAICRECQECIKDKVDICPNCGNLLIQDLLEPDEAKNFSAIAQNIMDSTIIRVKGSLLAWFGWFLAASAVTILLIRFIPTGMALSFLLFLLSIGWFFLFGGLLFSRWNSKRVYHVQLINPQHFRNEEERNLYQLIEALRLKSGLTKVPEVGIYHSLEINAFATGTTKNSSIVAFSTGLMDDLDESAIAAIAAHEIAHIANSDRLKMVLVQSMLYSIAFLIMIFSLKWDNQPAQFSTNVYGLIIIARFLCVIVLSNSIIWVMKAISRHRKFKADQLAAQLFNPQAMIHALEHLRHDKPDFLKNQRAYAESKVNAPAGGLKIFSTHPSLERRLE